MPDDAKTGLKLAILQSITAEAGGFYNLIVTVASTFLGGSLLFMEKIAPIHNGWSLLGLGVAWASLAASIGCIARLRYYNLKSGRLALNEDYTGASQIDRHTDKLSWWSQTLLIAHVGAGAYGLAQRPSILDRKEGPNAKSPKRIRVRPVERWRSRYPTAVSVPATLSRVSRNRTNAHNSHSPLKAVIQVERNDEDQYAGRMGRRKRTVDWLHPIRQHGPA